MVYAFIRHGLQWYSNATLSNDQRAEPVNVSAIRIGYRVWLFFKNTIILFLITNQFKITNLKARFSQIKNAANDGQIKHLLRKQNTSFHFQRRFFCCFLFIVCYLYSSQRKCTCSSRCSSRRCSCGACTAPCTDGESGIDRSPRTVQSLTPILSTTCSMKLMLSFSILLFCFLSGLKKANISCGSNLNISKQI